MWLIISGIIIGFFIGRVKREIIQFNDNVYCVRLGAFGLYVYKNFSDIVDFPWHCKFSEYFNQGCTTDKETCEKYINGALGENVVK